MNQTSQRDVLPPERDVTGAAETGAHVQMKRAIAGMDAGQQLEALRPPMPLQLRQSAPVQMAAKGNVADTGIVNEAQQMLNSGGASDMCDALDKLMRAAKQARDNQKVQRIKRTQKAKGCRHSRNS